jgi:hypothetical protein
MFSILFCIELVVQTIRKVWQHALLLLLYSVTGIINSLCKILCENNRCEQLIVTRNLIKIRNLTPNIGYGGHFPLFLTSTSAIFIPEDALIFNFLEPAGGNTTWLSDWPANSCKGVKISTINGGR